MDSEPWKRVGVDTIEQAILATSDMLVNEIVARRDDRHTTRKSVLEPGKLSELHADLNSLVFMRRSFTS